MRKHLTLGVALLLLAGCASARPQPGSEANDQLLLVVNNESSVDLTVFLTRAGSVRALGRVDRFDSRTFRVSRSSVAGPRIELRAFDESLHITPTQVLGVANQETRTVRSIAGLASGPFPSELAREISWRIGNTTTVLQVR
jgi:hypothetical protein